MELFHYSFMIRALIAGLVIAIIAPLVGNFLMMKRLSMVADTLSHIALVGVAIGLLTGTQPLLITILLTVTVAILIEWLRSKQKIPAETVLALFMPGGLAIALILISLASGFNSNLFSYLFGSISTVTQNEIYLISGFGLVVLAVIFYFYKQLLFTCFDETGAKIKGVKVELINVLLMTLTAITVAISMRIVGALLISALMVIPSATAMKISKSFKQTFIYSVLCAVLAVFLGLTGAFYLDLPAGGAIVLVALILFAGVQIGWRK